MNFLIHRTSIRSTLRRIGDNAEPGGLRIEYRCKRCSKRDVIGLEGYDTGEAELMAKLVCLNKSNCCCAEIESLVLL